ncbi:MAG: RHS repeat protein [Betaproteobacteria bacterium]|nr:RHS repeat protein [Betaproteobacteria bacterium]
MRKTGKILLAALLCLSFAQAWAGVTQTKNGLANTPRDSTDGCGCGSSRGMPVYSFKSLLASLNIRDTPIGYTPPVGPAVYTTLTYNQRETVQPATFDSFNIGQKWTLNWLTWIQDDPASPGNSVMRYVAGGGGWTYSGYNAATGAFAPERDNAAVLVMTSAHPITYELRFSNGAKDVFAASDNATSYPRKVLLTQVVDPKGNALTLTYDNSLRLTAITDAIGQKTTFQYGDSAAPLLVTGITDPFGRHATLAYDGQGRLISITDVIGMTSTFAYDSGTFIQSMTTPYGTTSFAQTQGVGDPTEASIQATDPEGYTQRTEYRMAAPGIPFSYSQAPSGMNIFDAYQNYRDSYHWDKDEFAAACTVTNGVTSCDYTKARMKHFMHTYPCCESTSRVLEDVRYPLEGVIWYDYAGQPWPAYPGTLQTPSDVGRVLSDGTSQVTHYNYNVQGLVTQRIDPDGRETDYTYAPNGIDLVEVQQKTASGFDVLARYTYNAQHEPLTYTDAAGQTTTYTYNARGQRTSVTDPLGETTTYVYDGNGYLTSVVDALGHVQRSFTYDAYGRVASDTDSQGYTRKFTYDALDRITAITYPDGTTTQYAWNKLDLASVTDRQGNTTTYTYDADRNLVAVTDPLGQVTKYTYTPGGKLATMTDPNGNTTTWTRDLEGRVIAKTYADGKGDALAYDNASRLVSVTDALGQTQDYSYDRADLVTGISYANAVNPTAAVTYSYDPYYRRLTGMSDGLGTTSFGYVPAGSMGALELASVAGPFGANDTVGYAYDALGRVIQRTTDVETGYRYDALGRVSEEANPLGTFRYRYLGDTDQVTGRSLTLSSGADGLGLTVRYDDNLGDRQLRRLTYRAADRGPLVAKLAYTHSAEHLLTSASVLVAWDPGMRQDDQGHGDDEHAYGDGDGRFDGGDHGAWAGDGQDTGDGFSRQRYDYDAAYRLTAVREHGRRMAEQYDYDAADNLVGVTGSPAPFTATANALNQLATVNGRAWQYDADGHLVNDGANQYAWDAAGRLVSVTDLASGDKTTYAYDGLGRRLVIDTQGANGAGAETHYLWCGAAVCQARDGSGAVMADYYSQGEVSHGQALYYVRDQLGSVIGVTDGHGKVLGSARYSAYGALAASSGAQPAFGFAGMLRDPSTGLYLTQYRAYDPAIGRWLSRDPIGEAGGENIYAYVGGDPVSYADPLGLWSISLTGYVGFGGGIQLTGTGLNIQSISFMGGIGLGGGISINPWGSAPDAKATCGSNSIGVYAEASAGVPGVDVGAGVNYGGTQAINAQGVPVWSGYGGWDPAFSGSAGGDGMPVHFGSVDFELGGGAGIQLTHNF